MKKIVYCIIMLSIFCSGILADNNEIIEKISKQLTRKDDIINLRFPINTEKGKWIFSEKPNWFAGFTAGELWYMYGLTQKEEFKKRALAHCDKLIQFAELDNTHDLGFIFFNSCVQAYKYTGEKKYREAAIKAAKMLIKRYNEKGHFLRAWGKLGTDDREGLLIIDTMMNLELLFWAAEETGDFIFKEIAWKHAITCMTQSIREDSSTYHVIEFNPKTGEVIKKKTHQGLRDETTWARGQAWGIYGFANAFKRTGDKRFLELSKRLSEYFIERLPADKVPPFDFEAKSDSFPKDASASAIAASGLFLLAEVEDSYKESNRFRNYAKEIIASLLNNYLFTNSKRSEEQGLLLHTVYNYPKGWGVDESYPAGDFYLIESLSKLKNYEKNIIIPASGIVLLNKEWGYLEEGIKNIEELKNSVNKWSKINLPHTWNKTDVLDQTPGYRRNIGWYQKNLIINPQKNKLYKLLFEGVNNKCDVFVNGKYAGGHNGAFVPFEIDISNLLKEGENQILVKVDNTYDKSLIPSQKSDFVIYGGLTRNVFLKEVNKIHLEKILVQTPIVNNKYAEAVFDISVNNSTGETKKIKLKTVLLNKHGNPVFSDEEKINLKAGLNKYEIKTGKIKNPDLWSPSSPALYTLKNYVYEDNNFQDSSLEKIGFRFYEFRDSGAFYLNGNRLLLRGTHRHEELSGYGNALSDEQHLNDIKMIKEMGANFIRLAHYPQSPAIYKACDELGLLVWDENPWCRGGVGDFEWKTKTKKIFNDMILANYNHPSIILWSIGNESDWLPDYADGDNADSLTAFASELHNLAKSLDPYRLTCTRKFPQAEKVVDVYSPSIWSGWYSDVYKNYEKALNKARGQYKKFFHAEFGGDSHLGRHTETPIDGEGTMSTGGGDEPINKVKYKNIANEGDWSESYIVDLFDWYLHITENSEWFTGSAQWIFRDFVTPLRPENPIPYVNQKGLVTMDNKPKDAYYVFKSYWTANPKFCYIESHTWTERYGVPKQKRKIKVFSNCSFVELFINGESKGKLERDIKKYPAAGLSWQVELNEGKNVIRAIGYEADKEVTKDEILVDFTSKKSDKPDDIRLTSERLSNGNYLITAIAVDVKGKRCFDFNRRIYFTSLQGGKLKESLGTPTGSSVMEMASGKAQIELEYIPFQKSIVEARTQDFKGSYIIIEN